MVPIAKVIAAKISLLKLRRTMIYVASKMVRQQRLTMAKYIP